MSDSHHMGTLTAAGQGPCTEEVLSRRGIQELQQAIAARDTRKMDPVVSSGSRTGLQRHMLHYHASHGRLNAMSGPCLKHAHRLRDSSQV